jgi:hypothetical protein
MHPAASLQFERMIDEYARWRAVPEKDRSPAPSWWWGSAMEVHGVNEPMTAQWCATLGLPEHSVFSAGANVIFEAMAGETLVPWPYDFPRKAAPPDPKVRDLHPQPSDDSAFQP